jgi:hypothetical protein
MGGVGFTFVGVRHCESWLVGAFDVKRCLYVCQVLID